MRAPLAAEPGKPLRYETEDKSNGTANICTAFEPLAGQRDPKVTAQRPKVEWAHFLQELVDQHDPHAEKIRLVLDNLHPPTQASLYEAFDPAEAKRIADKCASHSPPKHGSGGNMAERERSHLRRQCLADRIENKAPLIKEVYAWNKERHDRHAKAHWQFTTEDARVQLSRFYPTILT
jgi:hypothetical protein